MMLVKIISGGQTGADIAGLKAAKSFGLDTGGFMTRGCRTLDGYKQEYKILYNIKEMASPLYKVRTNQNVKNSDGTLRFARDFLSPGEKCTKTAILSNNKIYLDIDVQHPLEYNIVVDWIISNKICVLNIAGNAETTHPGIEKFAIEYLTKVFELLKERNYVKSS